MRQRRKAGLQRGHGTAWGERHAWLQYSIRVAEEARADCCGATACSAGAAEAEGKQQMAERMAAAGGLSKRRAKAQMQHTANQVLLQNISAALHCRCV